MTTKVTADEGGERPQAAVTRRDLPIATAVVRQDRGEGEGKGERGTSEPTSQDATVTDIPVAGPAAEARRKAEAEAEAEAGSDAEADAEAESEAADADAETEAEAGAEAGAEAEDEPETGAVGKSSDDGDEAEDEAENEAEHGGTEAQERSADRPARTTRVDVKVVAAPETKADAISEPAGDSPAASEPAGEEPEAATVTPPEPAGPAGPAERADPARPPEAAGPADATTVDPQVEEAVDPPVEAAVEAPKPFVPKPSEPLRSETMVEPLPALSTLPPPAPPVPASVPAPASASASAQNWHRYHFAVGAFLVAYCAAGLIGTVVGWAVRRGEIASYLADTIGAGPAAATPALIVIKIVEVLLTVIALAGVLRKKDVWYFPALTGWIVGFAVFCALDVWAGKTGRLVEHGVYLIGFSALLFCSYALSVKVRVARATAPESGRPAATANLSRTQEIALAALERWQR